MIPTTRDVPASLAGLAVVGVGLSVLAAVHAVALSADHGTATILLDLALLGGPAVGVAGIAHRASHDGIDPDYVPRVLAWTVGGGVGLAVFAWMILTALGSAMWDHDAVFVYNVGLSLGAFAGGLVGFQEARSLTRSREVSTTRAERERVESLNHLLRHDLLNTLNVIQGNVDLLAEEVGGDQSTRVDTIRRQSEKAIDLIRDVRVLAEGSHAGGDLRPVGLGDTIEAEVAGLRDAYPDASVSADVPQGVAVWADDLVGSVFENLLRNAVQHNDADRPEVTVRAEATADTVRVTVADDGKGIPDDELEDLFSPPTSGDHGFGLYLVRTLLDRYDGQIQVVETGPTGTTFAVELNRADAGAERID